MNSLPDKKRILALSGGGVRGIVEVAFLEAVEAAYRRRHGPDTQLSDVFHLIGGSSTGALIATALSLGKPMSDIRDFYLTRAAGFFSNRRWWRVGRAPMFDCDALEAEVRRDVGDMTLGDPALRTYLAIILKRFDTGTPWIVNNLPDAPYFKDLGDGRFRGNEHYQLARLLRGTTAAPFFFSQELIELAPGAPPGVFVDGGLSPYNDPSLALLKLARMQAFGLKWPLGAEQMFILSVGSGRLRPKIKPNRAATMGPLQVALASLRGVLTDNEQMTLTMMEWMGQSSAPSHINSEVGHLGEDSLTDAPLFEFLRLDLPLEKGGAMGLSASDAHRFSRMDDPSIIAPLYDLAQEYCAQTWDLDALLG
ncbi:hypothetical protein C1J03_15690 [Sulfitobacter sp. SK012]|uniref:patatin-like phospholipase family protein n=1 Tax=Sulfitobacter sp. SK012 TaxID=1389005 RepID=UPI000E0C7E7E|nr:patatin-like phospholipase family protein [Sulfitobacter sp. SK012]AXI47325.1 hypothetical protein C1J03_15690 [Sulfitobacter sp. SK012]